MIPRLAILHENPAWLAPLFNELHRRGIAFEEWRAGALVLDPSPARQPDLVFNRMSPSARWRQHAHGQFAALELLRLFEARGVAVINGSRAYEVEISKFRQVEVFRKAGVAHPRTLAVNHPGQVLAAAQQVGFPLFVKPNCGGAGHGVQRFGNEDELRAATLDFGCDHILLLQSDAATESLLRIELLAGEVLYAVRVERARDQFQLCPADACEAGVRFVPVQLPLALEQAAQAIARAAGFDTGSVECFVSPRTAEPVFIEINVLSNFYPEVAQSATARVVDYVERRLAAGAR